MSIFNTTQTTLKHVDDLIVHLYNNQNRIHSIDQKIVSSFTNQIFGYNAFTTKQADLAIKICRRYKNTVLSTCGLNSESIDDLVDNKKFRLPIRASIQVLKKIEIIKENEKYIKLTFPYDDELLKKIKEIKKDNPDVYTEWVNEGKFWKFNLVEGSVKWLGNLLFQGFEADEKFLEFYEKIQEISNKFEDYVPCLVHKDGKSVFKNVHESVPQPTSDKMLDALLLAKQHAIDVWDETHEIFLNSEKIGGITKKFITKEFHDEVKFQSKDYRLKDFNELLLANHSVMIVIPPENELGHLKKWHKHIISLGFTPNDITVMFRIENIVNKEFNDYVRDHHLNTPIHKDMKFVFVSRRIKKPLVQSGINFGIVISCDPLGSHINTKKIINDKFNTVVYVDNGYEENETL